MSANDDITKQHDVVIPKDKPTDASGSGSLGSHDPEITVDDDINEAYEDAFGNEPSGKTIAEEIDLDEKDLRD